MNGINFFSAWLIVLSVWSCGQEQESTGLPVAMVPSSFPVNFALLTRGDHQYVAYYDTAHMLTLAHRLLTEKNWDKAVLDSRVGWDSHNYLSLAIDDSSRIHLAGNMHSSPLVYFRSDQPNDIHSMQPIHQMVGAEEDVTTYPEFMTGPNGELIVHYRYGRSGSGYEVYNLWDNRSSSWSRLLDTPLTDGLGKMNAYMQGPEKGPDGYYHLLWVWRDTPDCATNHTLSYARSTDLINWQCIDGTPIELPITLTDSCTHVDQTQIYGGLLNIGIKIGFDANGQMIAGYHKYDSVGNTQLHLARFENEEWRIAQLTHWDYRWDFKGFGTIVNELLLDSPMAQNGKIVFGYHHQDFGDQQLVIDNVSLEVLEEKKLMAAYPEYLNVKRSEGVDFVVNKMFDASGKDYLLRWETLPPNRDKASRDNQEIYTLLELYEY